MSTSDSINKILDKAQEQVVKKAVEYTEKTVASTLSSTANGASASNKVNVDDTLAKAAKAAQNSADKALKDAQKAIEKQIEEYSTKDAARKIVDNALDKMIDDAVKKAKSEKGSKTQEELDDYIKAIVRGHKNTFFNSEKLLDAAAKDTKKQLDWLIDQQVKKVVDEQILTQALRPLNVAIHQQIDLKVNAALATAIRFDITKELNNTINGMLKDPLHDVNVTLNKLNLTGVSKVLNSQVESISANLTKDVAKGINTQILDEQKRIAAVSKKIAEIQKQVAAYEEKLKNRIKELQEKASAELKKLENKMIDEIKKVIKINI